MVTPTQNNIIGFPVYNTIQSNPKQLLEACKGNDKKLVESILKNSSSAEIKNAMEQKDEEGNSVLHLASQNGNVEIVTLLIQAGADLNGLNNRKETPLHLACKSKFDEIVELILNSGTVENLNSPDQLGYTPLSIACIDKNQQIVKLLIKAKVDVNAEIRLNNLNRSLSPLHLTSVHNAPEIAELLISAGADIDALNSSGASPLFLACAHDSQKSVEFLIDAGANLNLTNDIQQTPLQTAVINSPESVRFFLKALEKIDLDAADQYGHTALMFACLLKKNTIVQLLLNAGANKEISSSTGETPLHFACAHGGNGEVIEMLLANDFMNDTAWNAPAILSATDLSEQQSDPNLPPPISSGPNPVSSSSSLSSMATTPDQ